jgi:hypothetical protein
VEDETLEEEYDCSDVECSNSFWGDPSEECDISEIDVFKCVSK